MLAAAAAAGRSVAGRRGRADFPLHLAAGIARSPQSGACGGRGSLTALAAAFLDRPWPSPRSDVRHGAGRTPSQGADYWTWRLLGAIIEEAMTASGGVRARRLTA